MKSFRNLNLAFAALALCAFAVPGKAQGSRNSTPQTPVCTSYPEWSCEPQTVSSQERALAKKPQEKKASKLHAGNIARVKQPARNVSVLPDEDMRSERFGP